MPSGRSGTSKPWLWAQPAPQALSGCCVPTVLGRDSAVLGRWEHPESHQQCCRTGLAAPRSTRVSQNCLRLIPAGRRRAVAMPWLKQGSLGRGWLFAMDPLHSCSYSSYSLCCCPGLLYSLSPTIQNRGDTMVIIPPLSYPLGWSGGPDPRSRGKGQCPSPGGHREHSAAKWLLLPACTLPGVLAPSPSSVL